MTLRDALGQAQARANKHKGKLGSGQIKSILREFAKGGVTFGELGRKYGVAAATISYHVHRASRERIAAKAEELRRGEHWWEK